MLANDSVTVAVEVPVWLCEDDIAALEDRYGIAIVPRQPFDPAYPDAGHRPRHITGHIDIHEMAWFSPDAAVGGGREHDEGELFSATSAHLTAHAQVARRDQAHQRGDDACVVCCSFDDHHHRGDTL